MNKRNIQTKGYFPSIHLQQLYKDLFGYKKGSFPISEDISNRTLTLPFYEELTNEDIKIVVENLKEVLNEQAI
jgi:perosamine synthetase